MATLPYTKTHIEDKTTGILQNAGGSSINIGTIINSETGPLERVTLDNFNDLINYYCTGSSISANDDNTIQCVGALLNSTSVDVVRVGKSNIRIGRTNNNKIIYTDSNYQLIDILTKLRFSEIPSDITFISITIENSDTFNTYWVGEGFNNDSEENVYHVGTTVSIASLINGMSQYESNIVEYDDSSFIILDNKINSSDTVKAINKGYDVSQSLIGVGELPNSNIGFEIDGYTYFFEGTGDSLPNMDAYTNPIMIHSFKNSCSATWFLTQIIANFKSNTLVGAKIKYNASDITAYSDNLANRISTVSDSTVLSYCTTDKFDKLWFVNDGTLYTYNCTVGETGLTQGTDYLSSLSVTGDSGNFIEILTKFENEKNDYVLAIKTAIAYFNSDATILIESVSNYFDYNADFVGSLNKVELSIIEPTKDLNVMIDGIVYYCGTIPSDYTDVVSYYQLDKNTLTYKDFINKLYTQLNSDLIIGYVNESTILVGGDIEASSNTINLVVSKVDQSTSIEGAKFAIVAKFPCTKALFNYSFIKNKEVENYDVIDLTYNYNQISNTISMSFDSNAVDGYGTLLYYTKYNEDVNFKNPYIQIVELNTDVATPLPEESVKINSWGNEVILMKPSATDYADAISSFADYTDKNYSFIWDSGYANTTLAKAMKNVALARHAQAVPSFPSKFRKPEEFITFANGIDANSYEVQLVAPSFKNTFVGDFLTTVPAGLAYIVARVNSYNDLTSEMQPLFGATRGAVSAPNLTWNISPKDQQALADYNINSVITDVNGTYLNFNLTSQKINSYLSEEQNVYMSNVLAHVCDNYNPTIIAELNDKDLWDKVKRELTMLINNRLIAGHTPTIHSYRIICDETLNTPEVVEARKLIYKVQVQYTPSVAYVDAYVSVVRLNSF